MLGALVARQSVQPPSLTRVVATLEEFGSAVRVSDPAMDGWSESS